MKKIPLSGQTQNFSPISRKKGERKDKPQICFCCYDFQNGFSIIFLGTDE